MVKSFWFNAMRVFSHAGTLYRQGTLKREVAREGPPGWGFGSTCAADSAARAVSLSWSHRL